MAYKLWFDNALVSCNIQMQVVQQTRTGWLTLNWNAKLGFVSGCWFVACTNCILLWHLNSQNSTCWIAPPLSIAADSAMQDCVHLAQKQGRPKKQSSWDLYTNKDLLFMNGRQTRVSCANCCYTRILWWWLNATFWVFKRQQILSPCMCVWFKKNGRGGRCHLDFLPFRCQNILGCPWQVGRPVI